MIIKRLLVAFLTFCAFGLVAQQASAVKLGVGVGITAGVIEPDDDVPFFDDDWETATQQFSFAMIVCETCDLFSYRLSTGYGVGRVEYNDDPDIDDDFDGFHMNNTFAFNIIRHDKMTFWAGGSVYLGHYQLDGDVSDNEDTNIWGGGPTVGLDFAFGESIMSMELGMRFLGVDYDADYDDVDDIDDFEDTIDADLDDITFRFNWYF